MRGDTNLRINDYLAAFKLISDNLYSVAYVCDSNYTILAVSQKFLDEFLIKSEKEVLGKPFYKCKVPSLEWYSKNHAVLEKQFQEASRENKVYITLDILDYEQISKMYIVHKSPRILCGGITVFHVYLRPFGLPRLEDIIYYTHELDLYSRPLNTVKYKLTPKQRMVLFLFLRNYSYSEISGWMSAFGLQMSSARVTEHLTTLKNIFGAKNSNDLRTLAIQYGYHSEMPAGFLPNGAYCIENHLTEIKGQNDYPLLLSDINIGYKYLPNELISLSSEVVIFDDQRLNESLESKLFQSFYTSSSEMAGLFNKDGKVLLVTIKMVNELSRNFTNLQEIIIQNHPRLSGSEPNIFLDVQISGKIYLLQMQLLGSYVHIQIRKYVMPTVHRLMIEVFNIFPMPKISLPEHMRVTNRQHQVLFFYARNYSYSKVATILTELGYPISPHTINEHLETLKTMFNVTNKSQLIDIALVIGYALIPHSILKHQVCKLVNTDIHKWIC
ncbi:helix-turn-helix transcriptional regulator [Aquella oligotrophica]|uniref:HTH luxR-type domain-containing protein n=1 Tax=Aquella oligotrophica TaxID=2067065 RepID=A0A2I7N7P6_9NEIS|nr:hypothetical protein [Aquella oligotrophica]AUR52491.1 hypothetical protein CUN60_09335 [Aquella oligotrophica]